MKNSSPSPTDTLRFSLDQRVWFALDDKSPGVITGIMFRPNNSVQYYVTWGDKCESAHYESELVTKKDDAEKLEYPD